MFFHTVFVCVLMIVLSAGQSSWRSQRGQRWQGSRPRGGRAGRVPRQAAPGTRVRVCTADDRHQLRLGAAGLQGQSRVFATGTAVILLFLAKRWHSLSVTVVRILPLFR